MFILVRGSGWEVWAFTAGAILVPVAYYFGSGRAAVSRTIS